MLEPLKWWHFPVILAISLGMVTAFFLSLKLPFKLKDKLRKKARHREEEFTQFFEERGVEEPAAAPAPAQSIGPPEEAKSPEETQQEEGETLQEQEDIEASGVMDVFTAEEAENPVLKVLIEEVENVELGELLALCRETLKGLKKAYLDFGIVKFSPPLGGEEADLRREGF